MSAGDGYLSPERRDYFARHFDAVLVGGGDLLRFDRVVRGYDGPPLRPYHAFLEPFWDKSRPAILWNAPGVPFPFEPSRRPLVRRACSNVDYLSVRDEVSRGHLIEAGVEDEVHVVPDPGVLAAELVDARLGGTAGRGLLESLGVHPGERRLLCFQCSPAACEGREEAVARTLDGVAEADDLEILLLPLGPEDGGTLRKVRQAGGGRFVLVEDVGSPLETAAMVGACDLFAGSSLHGNLTALSFGVPHLVINTPRLAGLEGLVQLAGLEDFRITGWPDFRGAVERLASEPRGRWSGVAERLKTLASDHFDRVAAGISRATGHHGTPPGTTPEGGELLEAHAALAGLLDRLDDEREASRTTVERLETEIEEQKGSGPQPAARNGEDSERLRRRLAEKERTILDLGRELRNLEDLRATLRDRTELLAQREQEVELLTHRLAVRNHMTALRIGGGMPENRPPVAGRGA